MVSNTKVTARRRWINTKKTGRKKKAARAKAGTPKFPVHPDKG
jgi:hypothetical protein